MRPLDGRVLGHLSPARGALVAVVASGITSGLLTIAQAFLLASLVVRLVADPTRTDWHPLALALVLVVTGRAGCSYISDTCAVRAAGQVSTRLRERLLSAAERLPEAERPATADLTVLATRGVAAVEPYVTRYLPALVPAVVLPVATIVAIWSQDWIAGLIVVATLPLVPLFAALIGMATQERAQKQWREMETLSGHFLDVVTGLPTLVSHRRARAQVDTIRAVTHRYRRATVDTLKIAFASSTVLELIATLSVALVAVAVGLRLASGSVEFQIALTVLLLAPEAYWPLRRVGAEFHAAAEGTAALAEADDLLDRAAGAQAPGTRVPDTVALALHDLEVGYAGSPSLISPLRVALPSTGLLALTGPSGCGKSTLLATLRGTLAPAGGHVSVGGVALGDVDPAWWRAQVAWAPQRPWLVAGSVADNVRLARPEADDAEVLDALGRVGLREFVLALPGGLNAPLGEDGAGLSAGQRARVGLARVVLAQRPVVILDEPTAHLDADTESVLLTTLRQLALDSLIITVAHRPALVEAADLVISLSPAPGDEPESAPERIVVPTTAPPTPLAAEASDASPGHRWGLGSATLLGALSVASGVALTATAGWLITRASEHPPVLHLMVAIVGVRMFGLARPALRHAERVISHDSVLRTLAERRAQVFAALVPLVPGRLGPRRGDLLTSVVDDVDALLDSQLRVRQPLVTGLIVGAGAAVFAAFLNPGAGMVVAGVALAGPAAFWLARTSTGRAETRLVTARAELSVGVEAYSDGLGELQQWDRTAHALREIDRAAEEATRSSARAVRGTAAGRALTQVAAGLGIAAMAAVAAGPVTSENLALLLLLPLALVDASSPMADAGALSVRTAAARARLEALEQLSPAVSDPADPQRLTADRTLTLDRVSAAWDERLALAPLDCEVRPGATLGVVGESGSGKSTLAAVLARHIDPRAGTYSIGAVQARDVPLDEVRTTVCLVDDDPHVFSSTLAQNVRLARPDADDAAVAAALEDARLAGWVAGLPDGIHTFVGAGHRAVSGGERARIALARALLAAPDVLVLDEPTAHLDTATATALTADLLSAAAAQGRTVVWITHTSVGLDRMDRVLTLRAPGLSAEPTPSAAGV